MIDLGTVKPGRTIYLPFDTFTASSGAPTALTNFAAGDILIYKDLGTTARTDSSTAGTTATTSFDSLTGINCVTIDLSDNTVAGFYVSGSSYLVVVSPVTADGQTMTFVAGTFRIGYPDAMLNTSIATLATQTSFTLTAGPAEDNALKGMWAIIQSVASAVQMNWVQISAYTGATKTVTLAAGATYTAIATDHFCVVGPMPLQPVTVGRTAVVDAAGLVDANVVKIGPTGSGTAQTARDIGASVLLSSGTGAGQLSLSSGVAQADVAKLAGTTQTAGLDLNGAQTEPAQGAPAASATPWAKINYLYKAWRNKTTQTATDYKLFNDDAATVDHKASFADDGTTATKGEVATGP